MTTVTGIKTGWHNLNRMMGGLNELSFGKLIMIGGLAHTYKSGLLHALHLHTCLQAPPEVAKGKKPGVLFLTSMRRPYDEITWMYNAMLEASPDDKPVTPRNTFEVCEYVENTLQSAGWTSLVVQPVDHEYNEDDLILDIEKANQNGIEIRAVFIDDVAWSLNSTDLQSTLETLRHYIGDINILMVGTDRLNTDVAMLKQRLGDLYLPNMPENNYWDSAFDLSTVVDTELFVDTRTVDDRRYLDIMRGKPVSVDNGPVQYRNAVIPFFGYLTPPVDIFAAK